MRSAVGNRTSFRASPQINRSSGASPERRFSPHTPLAVANQGYSRPWLQQQQRGFMSKPKKHADSKEIEAAMKTLSKEKIAELRSYGFRLLGGTGFDDPLDLLHEAIARTVDGRRKWPHGVDFFSYLAQSMRSIASSERVGAQLQLRAHQSVDWVGEAVLDHSFQSSIERQLSLRQEVAAVAVAIASARRAMENDAIANAVLDELLAGSTPEETRAAHAISEKDFDSARHRVSRRLRDAIDRHFPHHRKDVLAASRASRPLNTRRTCKSR
ncbi:hypothetical protein bAD24_I14430 [Burkholderia sp. AD24]|jgi:DNA-directed RNA polymerase specialized sigma24 family protein|nr:hypothetical protein bAD24_I14430 [Burkholderia sp. AD24]